ncbi:hypothetical protein QVD17_19281 [Tagetes erecta]|uniref:Uncharacterized protein n=1 Tax=Tagetes erecta TaxID=13708 RepID=A0AAD8KQP6_TARER|nr:hypothetical protein QVD17_19281 [Tagetes erecta]
MRKLYNHNKGKIHPSPPPTTTTTDHLSLLPLAIATLATALSPQDQELLSYLLSSSSSTPNNFHNKPTHKTTANHPPNFNCYCFSCYTTYWVRWDASPNRHLIHEIIDAYEDGLIKSKKIGKNKKDRKKNKPSVSGSCSHAPPLSDEQDAHAPPQVEEDRADDDDDEVVIGTQSEKGPVRKFVNFIGERIWGVWGI